MLQILLMMKYYIAQNGQPVGPFEPNELLQQGLTINTQVWNETMSGWQQAGQVPELAALLAQQPAPPPFQQPMAQQQAPQQPIGNGQPQFGGAPASGATPYAQQPFNQGYARPQIDMLTAVKTCLIEKYCDFSSRARRSEFWWYILAYQIFSWIVSSLTFSLSNVNMMDYLNNPTAFAADYFSSPSGIISTVFSLALLLPTLGAWVRRLHDTGRSGLWLLLFLVPCVNFVFLIVLIVWACQDSQPMTNEYGPSPKYQ